MSAYVTVYTPGFKSVLNLPQKSVFHIPEGPNSRLVLCANFDASSPAHSCNMGDACRFVHADVSAAREHNIHVNYAWRSIEEVSYERFPAGQVFRVAPPNSKIASDVMDSDMVLKTRALTSHRRPLSHCAHYYFNRTCNLGSDCQFIHAIFIDPTAKPFQRAPVPSQLGEGRELQLSKKQRDAQQGKFPHHQSFLSVAPVAKHTAAAAAPAGALGVSLNFGSGDAFAARVAATAAGSATPVAVSEASSTPRSLGSVCTHCSSTGSSHKYRHDPYSPSQKVVMCAA